MWRQRRNNGESGVMAYRGGEINKWRKIINKKIMA